MLVVVDLGAGVVDVGAGAVDVGAGVVGVGVVVLVLLVVLGFFPVYPSAYHPDPLSAKEVLDIRRLTVPSLHILH